MNDTLTPIRVTFDEGDPIFDAWTNGDHWNGFATPLFTKENADKIAEMNNTFLADNPGMGDALDAITYDAEQDAYILTCAAWDGETVVCGHYNEQVGETLYAIGTYGWTWVEVTEPGHERVCVRSMFARG